MTRAPYSPIPAAAIVAALSIFSAASTLSIVAGPAFAAGPNDLPRAGAKPPAADGTLGVALMNAEVNTDGTLIQGGGAVSSDLISGFAGAYEVFFSRDVTSCTYHVTPFFSGIAYAQPRSGQPTAVFVQTQNVSGTNTNTHFYLLVYCAR